MESEFFTWVESQQPDIRYDAYPLQYKFDKERKLTFQKIFKYIKLKVSCCDFPVFNYQTVESMYELMKEIQLLTAMDLIQLLIQMLLQKQITFIQKMTTEENIPFQVGCNAFRCLSNTVFNPFNEQLFRLIIRIHYKTLMRFPVIITAFYNLSYNTPITEEEILSKLSKNFDEKAINVFSPFISKV